MARGKRNDRTTTSAGPGSQALPGAGPSGVPADYETVDYEEIDQQPSSGAPVAAESNRGDEAAGSMRDPVMTQPEDTTPSAIDPPAATEPERQPVAEAAPPRRSGGFVPGLIGGLLGSAVLLAGGGWYLYERGPVKPTLDRLTGAERAAHDAATGIATLDGKLGQVGAEVGNLKAELEKTGSSVAGLTDRMAATEKGTADLATNVEQASNSFRAAGDQVISRLEAVNAKLVEVEQAQPADVVDKKTVSDIAAKQASIEQATKSVAEGLARLEQLVAQSLEAGNQQAAALRTVVDANRSRMDEIITQQRDLLALKDQVEKQAETDQQQIAALAATGDKVTGVRTDLEQKLSDVTTKLSALDAARERGVGLSLAAHDLETALQSGQPFAPTLKILHDLGQGDTVVAGATATLEPMAGKGIPTVASLAMQLGQVGQTLQPVETAPANDWFARTRENLQGLINLHEAGEEAVPGQNAVDGAMQAMLAQDLPGAVAALKPLADKGNAAAADWIAAAQQRLDAAAAIQTLNERVKTMLVQQG